MRGGSFGAADPDGVPVAPKMPRPLRASLATWLFEQGHTFAGAESPKAALSAAAARDRFADAFA